jgi:RNA recognition motif-containing protein
MTKLFVGGFPLNMKELELVQLISPYGTVDTIKIVRDKKTGKCKGYAFLEMKDKAGAENAMDALNGVMLKDKALSLNIVPDAPPVSAPAPQRFAPKPGSGERFTRMIKPGEALKPKRPRKQF